MTISSSHRDRATPVWRSRERLLRGTLPAALCGWLLEAESLTACMQKACKGRFHVEVLREGWARATVNEARRLGMRSHRLAWVREVYLHCDATPWVYARTVIPPNTVRGPGRRLTRLGQTPLGAVLYADPTLRRSEVEVARLAPGQALFRRAVHGLPAVPAAVWGRRSVFFLRGRPLLVNEIFLPTMGTYEHKYR